MSWSKSRKMRINIKVLQIPSYFLIDSVSKNPLEGPSPSAKGSTLLNVHLNKKSH
jgi:hypothetical protein